MNENKFKENLPKNTSESTIKQTQSRTRQSIVAFRRSTLRIFLASFFCNTLLPSTDHDDGSFTERRSVYGFHFSTLGIFSKHVLQLLFVSNDGCVGRSVVEMTVYGQLPQPQTGSKCLRRSSLLQIQHNSFVFSSSTSFQQTKKNTLKLLQKGLRNTLNLRKKH